MSRVFHGFDASSGPMYISYRRKVSAPYSAITSSGFTTFFSDFDILATICATFCPVAVSTNSPSLTSVTWSVGTSDLSARWNA